MIKRDLKGPLASRVVSYRLRLLGSALSRFSSFASKKRYLIVFSCSPTPSAEVVKRNSTFCIQRKKDTLRCPLRWMQGWDLNLTTSGLWARRATKLLYPAMYFFSIMYYITKLLSCQPLFINFIIFYIFSFTISIIYTYSIIYTKKQPLDYLP